jgi:transcriptional regulator with XRE-family HTH domain
MAKELTSKQRQELAYSLFMNEELTQAEIAERVGTSRVTVNKWVNEGGWGDLKKAATTTMENLLKDTVTQYSELQAKIKNKEVGLRYPNSVEADILIKLHKIINDLKGDMSLADLISYSKKFLKFLRSNHPDKVKEIALLINAFIQEEV